MKIWKRSTASLVWPPRGVNNTPCTLPLGNSVNSVNFGWFKHELQSSELLLCWCEEEQGQGRHSRWRGEQREQQTTVTCFVHGCTSFQVQLFLAVPSLAVCMAQGLHRMAQAGRDHSGITQPSLPAQAGSSWRSSQTLFNCCLSHGEVAFTSSSWSSDSNRKKSRAPQKGWTPQRCHFRLNHLFKAPGVSLGTELHKGEGCACGSPHVQAWEEGLCRMCVLDGSGRTIQNHTAQPLLGKGYYLARNSIKHRGKRVQQNGSRCTSFNLVHPCSSLRDWGHREQQPLCAASTAFYKDFAVPSALLTLAVFYSQA